MSELTREDFDKLEASQPWKSKFQAMQTTANEAIAAVHAERARRKAAERERDEWRQWAFTNEKQRERAEEAEQARDNALMLRESIQHDLVIADGRAEAAERERDAAETRDGEQIAFLEAQVAELREEVAALRYALRTLYELGPAFGAYERWRERGDQADADELDCLAEARRRARAVLDQGDAEAEHES